MAYPPGQGKSGQALMDLWRTYLERYAGNDGMVEDQVLAGCECSAEVFGRMARMLDRQARLAKVIGARETAFREGAGRAASFDERLANALFALYGHLQSLSLLFVSGSNEAQDLIRQVNARFREQMRSGDVPGAAAAAARAGFALISLITLAVDQGGLVTQGIRKIEQRFRQGAEQAASDWDQILNAAYRMVEMMQMLVVVSDAGLRGQVEQIAARFEEEDHLKDRKSKLRNGFCRLFELAHLLTTHLDDTLASG